MPCCNLNNIPLIVRTMHYLNFTQEIQWANPCSLISNIEGAADHSYLENCSRLKNKIFTSYHLKINNKIWTNLYSVAYSLLQLQNTTLFLSISFKSTSVTNIAVLYSLSNTFLGFPPWSAIGILSYKLLSNYKKQVQTSW